MHTIYEIEGLYGNTWETVTAFEDYDEATEELEAYRRNEYGDDAVTFRLITVQG